MVFIARSVSVRMSIRPLLGLLMLFSFLSGSGAPVAIGGPVAQPASQKASGLRRADFMITGVSCATCLMRIERSLQAAPGVKKAAVSILKPYGALVIYDSKKTSIERILKTADKEPVHSKDMNDVPIDKIPLVVVPKYKPGDAGGAGAVKPGR